MAEGVHETTKTTSKVKRYSGSFVVTIAVVVAVVAFIAGTRGEQLLALVGPSVGIHPVTGSLDLSSVEETYRKLSSEYAGTLDTQKMIDGANKALAESTGDPYTKYFTAAEAADYNDDLSGNIGGGIGAEMGLRNNRITVIRTLPNSPAGEQGVKAGDIVLAVNGKSSDKRSLSDVVGDIRGEVGTTVKLSLQRGDDTLTVSIKRSAITAPDVESKIEQGISVITVSRFDKQTGQHIRAAAEDAKRQKVKGVVLDLRGNGGGYLEAAVSTASVWLNDKVVVTERKNNVIQDSLRSEKDPVLQGVPTVVLIDSNTASASEIVAGALHDYGVATLIGDKSFGKGSVQALIGLSDGAELKVTVAKWYTPKGNNINKAGITPDQKVDLTASDVNNGKDPQLEAAFKRLGV